MHFLFISTMSGVAWGGSEELWSRAALHLRQQGHEVSASVTWQPQLSPKVTRLSEQGIKVDVQVRPHISFAQMFLNRIKGRLGQSSPEASWLCGKKPDLTVISQGGNRDGLGWMKLCREAGLPYAAIIQCNAETWWPTDEYSREMAGDYHAAKKVFCVSRHNLQLLESQVGGSLPNAEVVWNPLNLDSGPVSPWPDENGVVKMACVARLEPAAKGQDVLFQVMSQTKWRERPLQASIYGAGPCEHSLKKLAERLQLKNVQFRGHAADVRKIWEENHLLVLPSRYEGLPLSLVEAMWCGRPAIVTDMGGNAEMCVDGETGFVAAAPAVGLLDQTLERAWNCKSDWQKIGLAGRARVEKLVPRDPIADFCARLTA